MNDDVLQTAIQRTHPRRLEHGSRGERGVTLVELLIAMMLMLVVMVAVYGVWSRLENSYSFTEDDMQAQAEARSAMGELIEYIRTARVPETVPDAFPVEYRDTAIPKATPFEIWLWTDIDRDPNHDLELIRFMVKREEGRTYLVRQESVTGDVANWDGAPIRVVNQNVRNAADDADLVANLVPLFEYTGVNGETLTEPFDVTDIRKIRIDLRVDIDPDRAPIVHELSSVVQPRNLRQY